MSLKHKFKSFLKDQFGLLIERDNPANVGGTLIKYLIKKYDIKHVVDVGANVGQYGNFIKSIDFHGRIDSFEPIEKCFLKLKEEASKHDNWFVHHSALGDFEGSSQINISNNFESSSILKTVDQIPMFEDLISANISETINVTTLDVIMKNKLNYGNAYLKIDTQGFELQVLKGAINNLAKFSCIEVETSFTSVYKGGSKVEEIIGLLNNHGFRPYNLSKGMQNPKTGQLFEMDIYFVKESLLS